MLPALLIPVFVGLLKPCIAYVTHADPDDCSSSEIMGQAEVCGIAVCPGKTVFWGTASCEEVTDVCADAGSPSCGPNSVLVLENFETIETGGLCYSDYCRWSRVRYTFGCCACPAGYIGIGTGCPIFTDPPGQFWEGTCVGCTETNEKIVYNEASRTYICKGPDWDKRDCEMRMHLNQALGALGLASNILGSFCPFSMAGASGILGTAATAGSFTMDYLMWLGHSGTDSTGVGGTTVPLASAIMSALSALAVTAGAAALGPGFTAALGSACLVNSLVGLALGVGQNWAQLPNDCSKPGTKRRDLSPQRMKRLPWSRDAGPAMPARDQTFKRDVNECELAFSIFDPFKGFDVSSWDDMIQACDDLRNFSPADTMDLETVQVYRAIMNVCNSHDKSLVDAFVKILQVLPPDTTELCAYVDKYKATYQPPRYVCEDEPVTYCPQGDGDGSFPLIGKRTDGDKPSEWSTVAQTDSGTEAEPTESAVPQADSYADSGDIPDEQISTVRSAIESVSTDGVSPGPSGAPGDGCEILFYRQECFDPEYPVRKCEPFSFEGFKVWFCDDGFYQDFPYYDQVGPIVDDDDQGGDGQDSDGQDGSDPSDDGQGDDGTSSDSASLGDTITTSTDDPPSTTDDSGMQQEATATTGATERPFDADSMSQLTVESTVESIVVAQVPVTATTSLTSTVGSSSFLGSDETSIEAGSSSSPVVTSNVAISAISDESSLFTATTSAMLVDTPSSTATTSVEGISSTVATESASSLVPALISTSVISFNSSTSITSKSAEEFQSNLTMSGATLVGTSSAIS